MPNFRKKLILLLLAGLGVVAISLALLYYFQQSISKKVNLITNYKRQLSARTTLLDRIRLLAKESKEAQPYLARLKNSLPSETEMVGLESALQRLAKKNNLSLSFRFGLANKPQGKEPSSYSFNLVLAGKETDILNWLSDFQNLPYSVRLEQIEFRQMNPGATGENTSYTVKILGRIYLRTENAQGIQKK